jgi:transcriptional regulator with XRE-family HTH domain
MLFVPQHIARCLFTMRGKSPNPIDEHAGLRVRMRRKMLSMSQTELGKGIGVTFQQVQKHEKGTTHIGASRLQRIAAFFTCRSRSFLKIRSSRERRSMSAKRIRRATCLISS